MDPNLLVQALMQFTGLAKPKPAPTPAATPIPPQKPWEVPQAPPGPQAVPPINLGAGSGPFNPTDTGVPADALIQKLMKIRQSLAAGNEFANPGDRYTPGQ